MLPGCQFGLVMIVNHHTSTKRITTLENPLRFTARMAKPYCSWRPYIIADNNREAAEVAGKVILNLLYRTS